MRGLVYSELVERPKFNLKYLRGPTLEKAKYFLIKITKFYLSFSKVGPQREGD